MKSLILKNEFGDEERWVVWKKEIRNKKLTKVPYQTTNECASSSDPKTWNSLKKVEEASTQFSGIGIMFTLDELSIGIDIDGCLKDGKIIDAVNKEGKVFVGSKEKIIEFVKKVNTYMEYSPSGNGIHVMSRLTTPLTLEAKRKECYECYTSGRFFTVTNKVFWKELPVRTIPTEEMLELLKIIGYPWKEDKNQSQISLIPAIPTVLSDENLIKKMFKSKTGERIKSIYNGDTSFHDGNTSSADESLCSSLAFWTGKNYEQIERIWMSSPLGSREKTQKREDYRKSTINKAISLCGEIYEPKKNPPKLNSTLITQENKWEEILKIDFLFTSKKGKKDEEPEKIITLNTENICRALLHFSEFKGLIRIDTFKNTLEICDRNKWRNFIDSDALFIQTRLSIIFPFFQKVRKDMVFDAIMKVAWDNKFDSANEYLKSLTWDKTSRIHRWLTDVYGVTDNIYHQAVGSNWIKGLVKRIVEPGCKFDQVLVLEGEQGVKKSTSFAVLGGEWHLETTMAADSKDFFMQFAGKAIIEFSEGESMTRTEVKRMKAIITMQNDNYRVPYGRVSQDFPRRCVFAMTTNHEEYLKDETGNRRWLPVKVIKEEADIEWLKTNRDQLFAEAYERVITKRETVWEYPKEETMAEQDARRIQDPNTELIAHWYYNELTQYQRNSGITIFQVFKDALHGGMLHGNIMKKYEEMAIGGILKNDIKLIKKRRMVDNIQQNRWYDDKDASSEEEEKEKVKSIYQQVTFDNF